MTPTKTKNCAELFIVDGKGKDPKTFGNTSEQLLQADILPNA